jgi:hypothetical protein
MKTSEAIQKLRDTIRLRHFALSTEQSYCSWVERFAKFVMERCPMGAPNVKMEAFLTQLAKQDVSASTQTQAFNALLFFYREVLKLEVGKVDSLRAKKPAHLRYAPEMGEVFGFAVDNYFCGEQQCEQLVRQHQLVISVRNNVTRDLNHRTVCRDAIAKRGRSFLAIRLTPSCRGILLPTSMGFGNSYGITNQSQKDSFRPFWKNSHFGKYHHVQNRLLFVLHGKLGAGWGYVSRPSKLCPSGRTDRKSVLECKTTNPALP